jgi:hypothetical protein
MQTFDADHGTNMPVTPSEPVLTMPVTPVRDGTGRLLARHRTSLGVPVACLAALALSGCMAAPTYGTGKRADLQLVEDISNIMTLTPKEKEAIDYQPRPGVVAPPTAAVLPAPQERIAAVDGTWPESPEERRKRLRDEATANQSNQLFRPLVAGPDIDESQSRELTPEEQLKRFREGRAIQQGAYQGRRFLSDPPLAYKEPVATAPVGELGEPEKKKEARRLREARKQTGFSLRRLWPWGA